MNSKFYKVVAATMAGVAQCADQLGDFEVHCVGTSFKISSEKLYIDYLVETASGYGGLYIEYLDDVWGYHTDDGEPVWDLEKIEKVISGVFSLIKNS